MIQLYKLTTPKINYLRENLNLTDEELIVFDMAAKNRCEIQMADRLNVSVRTVRSRKKAIRDKIKELEELNGFRF